MPGHGGRWQLEAHKDEQTELSVTNCQATGPSRESETYRTALAGRGKKRREVLRRDSNIKDNMERT